MHIVDDELVHRIKYEYCCFSEDIAFFISVPTYSFNKMKDYFSECCNVFIVAPSKQLDRTEHWEFITAEAKKTIKFKTFSFLFCGDEIKVDSTPLNLSGADIYINDYFLNSWSRLKRITATNGTDFKHNLRLNLYLGKPPLAPLQRIIFSHALIDLIKFNARYPYVCDQLLVHSLFKAGYNFTIIHQGFYKINSSARLYSKRIKTYEIIRQQLVMYISMKCYIGIPMLLVRTLSKLCIITLLRKNNEEINR